MRTILRRQWYGDDHPWCRDAIEAVEALGGRDDDELAELKQDRLEPASAHLVWSGSTEVLEGLDLTPLDAWSSRGRRARPELEVPERPADRSLEFHMLGSSPDSSSLFAMHVGPGISSPDQPAFAALCHLLGGMLSEAGRQFRHEGGETYGVHTTLYGRVEVTECLWSGTFAPGTLARAADQHRKQIERLAQGDIDDRGLKAARGQASSEHTRRFANPTALARWTARQRALGLMPPQIERKWAGTPDLSDDRLRDVARSAFDRGGLDFVAFVGSPQDYYGISGRGAVLTYRIERADE